MNFHFQIECDWCDAETYVTTEHPSPEPNHCPMCGEHVRPIMVGEDEVDENLGDIIDV